MKNKVILLSFLCALILSVVNCGGGGSGEDEVTTGTITVKATYNGDVEDATQPGTHKIYVYLYKTLSNAQAEPDYKSCTSTGATVGVESTITVNNIAPGNYYVVIFYDYKAHNTYEAGKDDRYIISDSARYPSDADPVTVSEGSSDILNVSFGNDYTLNSSGTYDVGTITVKATYNGDVEDATQPGTHKIYVYLYKALTLTAQDIPDYKTCTESGVTVGVESTITISNIIPDNYYVVVFYDYKAHNTYEAGKDDRYIIYNAAQFTSDADAVTVGEGTAGTLTMSFDNSYTLNSSGAYDVP